MALPGLIDTLLHSRQLEGPCYDCLWRGDKGTWHRIISSVYHRWPELWHYFYCFVQSGEAFTVKRNKHTHVHVDIKFADKVKQFDDISWVHACDRLSALFEKLINQIEVAKLNTKIKLICEAYVISMKLPQVQVSIYCFLEVSIYRWPMNSFLEQS